MPCGPCWPAGPNLCSSQPLIGAGKPRPCQKFACTNPAHTAPPRKLPQRNALPLLLFVAFLLPYPRATNCLNLFCSSPLRCMWQSPLCKATRGAKTAFRQTKNRCKHTRRPRCPWLPITAILLSPDLFTIFCWRWQISLFLSVCTHLAIFSASAMFSARLADFYP